MLHPLISFLFFFFNDTATTEIYTLSLHDALPIYPQMEKLRLAYRELPYRSHSEKLLSAAPGDHAWVELLAGREGPLELESGRRDLQLVKLTGSAFASFARDPYTTLPERNDRPLHIHLDVF